MHPTLRVAFLGAIIIGLLVPMVVAESPESAEASLCPEGMQTMDGVGLVCPRGDLFEVYSPALESLGFIHGTDPVPEPAAPREPDEVEAGTNPSCVSGAAGTYYTQVIYARASNDADQYAALLNEVRWLVGQSNKLVDDAGVATGSPASLRIKCVSGQVEVKNEALPTAKASASFSTIVSDLRAKGYNDAKVKYWVYYDDTGACLCGGTAHIYYDDSLALSNLNNGNGLSMYAVNFGYNSTRIMLHELAHNMGAVQKSAPHSTLAGHCYDGRDTLCYNDDGANGSLYATTYCTIEVFDCGKTDYFHASPPPGSYLATHWNLGSSLNRYIAFGPTAVAPTLASLTCTPNPVETNTTLTCTFAASDPDSTGVRYVVSWGDATSTTVPASGYATPGTSQSATHVYTVTGTKTVSVTVTDSDGITGNTLTASVTVESGIPVLNLLSCPTAVLVSALASCSVRAADNSPGVRYTIDWGDGTTTSIPTTGYVTPGVIRTASHAWSTLGSKTVTADVVDSSGKVGAPISTVVTVTNDVTPPEIIIQDPKAANVYRGCATKQATIAGPVVWLGAGCVRASITDASSGVDRMEVFVDGIHVGTDTVAPYQVEFPVTQNGVNAVVRVDAYDHAGNKASRTVLVSAYLAG